MGISRARSSPSVGRGPLPQVIYRGIRPEPRKIGIPEVIYGESRPSPPRSRAGRSSQMAGNGTYATLWMEIDYVPIRSPVSGANWRRTNYMRTSKRAWGGSSPPRTGVAPRFQAEWGETGDATGVEGARRGRADRVAGPEARICSIPSQKGAFSGPPIGTWSVSRQPAPIEGGTGGPEARSPWLWTCNPKLDSS